MANLHKFTVQESLNANLGQSGKFNILTASNAGTADDVANTNHVSLSSDCHQILIYAAGDIYFNFDIAQTDCSTSTNPILAAETLHNVAVPHGIKNGASDTIYLNYLAVSTSSAAAMRIVEV